MSAHRFGGPAPDIEMEMSAQMAAAPMQGDDDDDEEEEEEEMLSPGVSSDDDGWVHVDRPDRTASELAARARMLALKRKRPLIPTEEWVERRWLRTRGSTIPTAFWKQYAIHLSSGDGQPFLPSKFVIAACSDNAGDVLLALAVLDVPLASPQPSRAVTQVGEQLCVSAGAGPALVLFRALTEAAPTAEEDEGKVLVASTLFDARSGSHDAGETVTELVAAHAYGMRIVVSNVSAAAMTCVVTCQIPLGAVPLGGSPRSTFSRVIRLNAFATQSLPPCLFYIPSSAFQVGGALTGMASGTEVPLAIYPARVCTVTGAARVLAHAQPLRARIRLPGTAPTPLPAGTKLPWIDACQSDEVTDAQLATRLASDPDLVLPRDVEPLLWRCRSSHGFHAIRGALASRCVYSPPVWAYGLLHGDAAAVLEWIPSVADALLGPKAHPAARALLTGDDSAREVRDFVPLIAARAAVTPSTLGHASLADDATCRSALDVHGPKFRAHWRALLERAARVPIKADPATCVEAAQALVLQERVADAQIVMAQVPTSWMGATVQVAYLRAYLSLRRGADLGALKEDVSAMLMRGALTPTWRSRFEGLLDLCASVGGPATAGAAASGPSTSLSTALDACVRDGEVVVRYVNAGASTVRMTVRAIDVELLFSTDPYAIASLTSSAGSRGSRFADVLPTHVSEEPVSVGASGEVYMPLPPSLGAAVVDVHMGAGVHTSLAHFGSSSLSVLASEAYGTLAVLDGGSVPVAGAYVKVYAKTGASKAKFWKDGYTDVAGCFDYAAVSGGRDAVRAVTSFAVLIVDDSGTKAARTGSGSTSDSLGAAVRLLGPVAQT